MTRERAARHRGRTAVDLATKVPPVLRALVSERAEVFLELEPGVSLLWCIDHVAWHRVRYAVQLRDHEDEW